MLHEWSSDEAVQMLTAHRCHHLSELQEKNNSQTKINSVRVYGLLERFSMHVAPSISIKYEPLKCLHCTIVDRHNGSRFLYSYQISHLS